MAFYRLIKLFSYVELLFYVGNMVSLCYCFLLLQALAKNARFEQIWRSRKGVKDAKDDQLHDIYHIYDIVRLDTNEISSEAPKAELVLS